MNVNHVLIQNFHLLSVTSITGNPIEIKLALSPLTAEVPRFANESYYVTCLYLEKGVKIKWKSPKNKEITDKKGRIYIEEVNRTTVESVALVFTSIQASDNGNWTCEAEGNDERQSFKLIVNGEFLFSMDKN